MSSSTQKHQATREEKREAKRQKKAERGPGLWANAKQAYQLAHRANPNIGWILALIVVVTLLVFLLLGILLHNWLTFLIIGIPVGALVSMFYLSRRAEKAAFGQIEGQPGAAGAALSTLRRGWILEEQPVAYNARTQDLVFRALGRPGVVLVTEGPNHRVGGLVAQERKRVQRVAGSSVPIHVIHAGSGKDQVALKNVTKEMRKLDKALTMEQVHGVNNRLASLQRGMPMPKGVDPMRARPDRKGMRGR